MCGSRVRCATEIQGIMNNPVYLDAEKRRGVFDEIAETTAIYNAFVEEGGTFHNAGDQFSRNLSRAELVLTPTLTLTLALALALPLPLA